MSAEGLQEKTKRFRTVVLSLYETRGRKLPWRQTTDVYAILVSEVMLQQTQVERVLPKYKAFLEAFPTPRALANASFPDVLRLWQGLGYNNRAKRLKQAAATLVENPRPSVAELEDLPGVGPYTARAVAAFAYNQDVVAVDVNVKRVVKRYFGKEDEELIALLVPKGRSRDWHNALMDFGATVCTKRAPSCKDCPLSNTCHALANNTFSDEPSASQGRFLGTVRWHRGQLLKLLLNGETTVEKAFAALDERHRDKTAFDKAVAGLRADGLISGNDTLKLHNP